MLVSENRNQIAPIEWPTITLILGSYGAWILLLFYGEHLHPSIWILLSALNITFFMSITHEVVHGHPTRSKTINRLLILLPIGWSIPFERFERTHLDHHDTEELTDPFDDPESWYVSLPSWIASNFVSRQVLVFNNTLFGRMLIGPLIGLSRFYVGELKTIWKHSDAIVSHLTPWICHLVLCGGMAWAITGHGEVPLWQWVCAVYIGHSILLIRTFLEHQAAPDRSQRTVLIETPCPIAFLFLFNNYHFVHHDQPHIPWYKLPKEYQQKRDQFLAENGAYVYKSYLEIFRKFFFRSKEPVAHPFLRNS